MQVFKTIIKNIIKIIDELDKHIYIGFALPSIILAGELYWVGLVNIQQAIQVFTVSFNMMVWFRTFEEITAK